LLAVLDEDRKASGDAAPGPLVRERSADGDEIRIIYSACRAGSAAAVIRREIGLALEAAAKFEWKLYGHDGPPELATELLAAGLEPKSLEAVLALNLRTLPAALASRLAGTRPVRSVGEAGLSDYERISIESGRGNARAERARLAASMAANPGRLQVHVAYRDDVPVSGGRLYLHEGSTVAELAGGRTVPAHRRNGHFTTTVLSRIAAAIDAGAETLWVDALPTSAPILTGLGFIAVTWTQPYVLPESRCGVAS
jgi:hypothetical protein